MLLLSAKRRPLCRSRRAPGDHVRPISGIDSPPTLDALQVRAICLSVQKRYDQPKPLFAEAVQVATRIKIQDGLSGAWYNSARGAAVSGHPDDALQDFRRAIEAGYADAGRMAGRRSVEITARHGAIQAPAGGNEQARHYRRPKNKLTLATSSLDLKAGTHSYRNATSGSTRAARRAGI